MGVGELLPIIANQVPDISELLKAFEDDLSTFKFKRVVEFESYIDTII